MTSRLATQAGTSNAPTKTPQAMSWSNFIRTPTMPDLPATLSVLAAGWRVVEPVRPDFAAGTVPERGCGGGVWAVTPLFFAKSGPTCWLRFVQKLFTLHRRRRPTLGTLLRENPSTKIPRGKHLVGR